MINQAIIDAYWALGQAVAEFDHHGINQDDRACNGRNQCIEAMKALEIAYPGINKEK